jgi:PhzF family phenazine biosynthesis protein
MSSAPLELEFVTLDVFTQTKYEGNPLGIVNIPKTVTVSQEQKQAIAREFNLSETTFVHEPKSDELAWTVDIFMTTKELPFAGHPTIGSACYVLGNTAQARGLSDGVIEAKFNIKAGPVGLQYDVQKKSARAAIPHDFHIHGRKFSKGEVLGLQPGLANYKLHEEYPIVSVVKGMAFVLIELENEDALAKVSTTAESITVDGLDAGWDKTFVGTYYFVRVQGKDEKTKVLRTRMIEGSLEDPATGSAASDLAGYLSLVEGKPKETIEYAIIQGVEMGRRSEIGVEVQRADGEGIANVYLKGSAIQVMEGRLKV